MIGICQLKQLMHLCFLPTRWSYMGQDLPLELWHIEVTWLSESSSEGILLLPHPMLPLGHVATVLCITSIFICAETCWLEIFSIKPTILSSYFDLSIWSGPQTLPPSDWSKVWGAIIVFLEYESQYSFSKWLCYWSPVPGLAAHAQLYYSTGHSCFFVFPVFLQ